MTVPPTTGEPDVGAAGSTAASLEVFRRLLVNTLMSGVTRSFLWFA